MKKKKIILGASGASGFPVLGACLKIISGETDFASCLIMSDNARLTLVHETGKQPEEYEKYADYVFSPDEIGAGPASGTFRTAGMVIVPCSMKTAAGICSGYTDNLLLRAADVTIKEHRTLALGVRETPLNPVHLRNLYELSKLPDVWIIPLMMTFYHHPEQIEDMVYHMAAKLLAPFGIEAKEYRRWNGL